MRPVCPKCCPFPLACPGGPFPLLGEFNGLYRLCPNCGLKTNETGLPITHHKTTEQKKKGDDDPSNPGNLLLKNFQRLESLSRLDEKQQRWLINYFLKKYPLWDKNYLIYRIAENYDIRPGIVRGIYHELHPPKIDKHEQDINGKFIEKVE